jgi:TRAP-type C4-dicarboxylate transport system substrate-binding protein
VKIFSILAVTAILGSCGPVAAAQTLKIATLAPEGSFWMTEMRAGAQEIEARTDGRVNFRFYGGGVQGNDNQVRRKMRIGQLHGATFISGALGQFTPAARVYSLPMTFFDMDEVRFVRERMDGRIRQALEDSGMVNFGLSGAGVGYLMSTRPVRTLADMSGQKTWVGEGDQIAYEAFKALGISPVTMPLTDVLTGLQTQLLDSVTVSPTGAVVLQLHTTLRYITDLQLSYVYGALVIDRGHFGKLDPADRAIVREVMEKIYLKIDAASVTDNTDALQALQQSGLEMVAPETTEIARWREMVAQSNRTMAEQGIVPADLMAEMLAYIADFRSGDTP